MKIPSTAWIERSQAHIGNVDRAGGWLRGVKLVGGTSRNGRRYPGDTLSSAVELYRGKKVYVDHPKPSDFEADRSVRDWVGTIHNPRFEAGAIYGDVLLRKASPMFEEIVEMAELHSSALGFSHVADGDSHHDGGIEVIDRIKAVYSVDLVTEPATTSGLFESWMADEGDNDVSLANCGDKISDVVERLAVLAVEKPGTVPQSLLGACVNVAGIAMAIQHAETKRVKATYGESTKAAAAHAIRDDVDVRFKPEPLTDQIVRSFANRLR